MDCVLDCLSALCFRDRLTHLVTVPTGAVLLGIRLFVILVVADFYCLFFIFIFYFVKTNSLQLPYLFAASIS